MQYSITDSPQFLTQTSALSEPNPAHVPESDGWQARLSWWWQNGLCHVGAYPLRLPLPHQQMRPPAVSRPLADKGHHKCCHGSGQWTDREGGKNVKRRRLLRKRSADVDSAVYFLVQWLWLVCDAMQLQSQIQLGCEYKADFWPILNDTRAVVVPLLSFPIKQKYAKKYTTMTQRRTKTSVGRTKQTERRAERHGWIIFPQ